MPKLSEVFLVFYAVLYGVLFTLSDRWRPFFTSHTSRHGWKRLALSLVLLGLAPVSYLILILPKIAQKTSVDWYYVLFAVYEVAPIGFFYILWVIITLRWREIFYSRLEQGTEPVKSSLKWVGKETPTIGGIAFWCLFLFGIPLALLLIAF